MSESRHVASPAKNAIRICWRMFKSYQFRLCATVVCAALAFLPIYMKIPTESLQGTVLAASLRHGKLFYESSYVAIALVVPMFLDTLCDLMLVIAYKRPQTNSKKTQASSANLTILEKILILIGFLMVPATALLPPESENLAMIFLCCKRCQMILIVSILSISWCRMFPERFLPGRISFSVLCFNVGQLGVNFSYTYSLKQDAQFQQIGSVLYVMYIVLLVRPYTLQCHPALFVSPHPLMFLLLHH